MAGKFFSLLGVVSSGGGVLGARGLAKGLAVLGHPVGGFISQKSKCCNAPIVLTLGGSEN